MANIVRHRPETEQSLGMPAFAGWDPFQIMREMLSWDPWRAAPAPAAFYTPAFEVKETPEAFVIRADLPGVEEQDVEVNVTGRTLSISGKRESETTVEGETYHTFERSYGSFHRSFTLPDGVDPEHVEGELRNGVLTIHVPKQAAARPRRITLKGLLNKVKSLGSGDKASA